MNEVIEVILELVKRIQQLEQRIEYLETVENNVFSRIKFTAATELTIAGGEVTVSDQTYYKIDTQDDDPADDLNTINGHAEGKILILCAASATRVPTLKDGADNLRLAGDFDLDAQADKIMLIGHVSGNWDEVCRSSNA